MKGRSRRLTKFGPSDKEITRFRVLEGRREWNRGIEWKVMEADGI